MAATISGGRRSGEQQQQRRRVAAAAAAGGCEAERERSSGAAAASGSVPVASALCSAWDRRRPPAGGSPSRGEMEQLSDEELDHGAEEDSDKEDQDLDKMFGAWLGELDKLTQSLDSDKPVAPVKRSPLHQETNLANFSYRFSMYNLNEALNQGETVDLDALMADLCSIEQELSSIGSHSANNTAVKRLATESKVQKPPASRPSTKHGSMKGLSSSSGKVTKPPHANVSLDDITAQLEKASLSMDEAAQQSIAEDAKP